MNLRPRSKNRSRVASLPMWGARSGSFIFILAAASLFLFSSVKPASLQTVRTGVTDLAAPILVAVNYPIQQAADYVQAVTGLAALQAENARLRAENNRLRDWYQTALLLKDENAALKKLMNVEVKEPHAFVTGRVLADSGNSYVKSLLVLAGKDQNVEKGQAVLAADGLVGRVIEAGHKASRILLMTDINSRIPVQIGDENHKAIMGGNNNGLPVLLHLPPGSALERGDRVVTSGHGGMFPYGVPVGEISVDSKGQPVVQPYASVERVTYVRIMDYDSPQSFAAGGL